MTGSDRSTGRNVPFWLASLGAISWRLLVLLALAVVLGWVAFTVGTVTASIIVAGISSVAVLPVVRSLRGRGWGAAKAAGLGTLIIYGTIVLILGVAGLVLVRYGPDLINAIKAGLADLNQQESSSGLPQSLSDTIKNLGDAATGWLSSNAGDLVTQAGTVFTILLFGGFTTFYLLASGTGWWPWLIKGLSEHDQAAATAVGTAAVDRLGSFVRRVAIVAAVRGVVTTLALAILGVPIPLAIGTFVFVSGFVPYVGALAAGAVILVAVVASTGTTAAVLVLAAIVAINFALEWAISRWLHDGPGHPNPTHVNPAILLVGLLVGAYVAGILGLVLAGPVVVAILAGLAVLTAQHEIRPSLAVASGELVPPWLDHYAAWAWRLLAAMALAMVLVVPLLVIPMLLVPLIMAAVLAPTLVPAVAALVRRGWSPSLAAAVSTAVLTGAVLGLTALAIGVMAGDAANLVGKVSEGAGKANDAISGLGGVFAQFIDGVSVNVASIVLSVTAGILALTIMLGAGIILTFVALRDGHAGWATVTSTLAPWRREVADEAASKAVGVLGGYVIATGVVSVFGAFTQFVLMVILGVPLALPVFVLSVFSGYIPYIGSMLTTLLALVLTVTTGNPVAILIMLIFTVVFNIVQGNIVQPLVFSKAVNIHPAIILLAIPAGNSLAGILGMFLVVPILGVIAATWHSALEFMGPPPELRAPDEAETAAVSATAASAASLPPAAIPKPS
jgi:putative heme transporter